MTIVVTGATGPFGRLAVESLLARGIAADRIVAVGRSVEKIQDLADRGVVVKQAAYEDPEALRAAFAGADKLLFVSGSEVGRRVPQHTNVIAAAQDAGIAQIAYTSIPYADTTDLILAVEHLATERALQDSGIPSVFLRNNMYLENYDVRGAVERGFFGASGRGGSASPPAPTWLRRLRRPSPRTGTTSRRTSWAAKPSPRPNWPPRSPGSPAGRSPTPTCRRPSTSSS
ncbi:MAG: NAD(P)H-binding protein [Actinoplanes sp.]